jgi:hypothetical protein
MPSTYVVKANDSFARIAGSAYGNQRWLEELANANGGLGRILHPGDVITLPDFDLTQNPFVSGGAMQGGGGGSSTPKPGTTSVPKPNIVNVPRPNIAPIPGSEAWRVQNQNAMTGPGPALVNKKTQTLGGAKAPTASPRMSDYEFRNQIASGGGNGTSARPNTAGGGMGKINAQKAAPPVQGPRPQTGPAFQLPGAPRVGQTSTGQGGYRSQTAQQSGVGAGRDIRNPTNTTFPQPTEVDYAMWARYSGINIAYAVSTGDRKWLPDIINPRTARHLAVPEQFESIEVFLAALGYQVDEYGNWRKYNPVKSRGYGGGGYATQSYSGGGGGGGGYGGYGGGYARGGDGYGGQSGLTNWRIG